MCVPLSPGLILFASARGFEYAWHAGGAWFQQPLLRNLQDATDSLAAQGATLASVEVSIRGSSPRPWPLAIAQRVHGELQQAVGSLLRQQDRIHPEVRMRHKMSKWGLPVFPRVVAHRAVLMLRRLHRLVAPRVIAAVLRTLWNGWCTRGRFQQVGCCVFGCLDMPDDVRHYSYCPVLARFGRDRLRLPYWSARGPRATAFFLCEASDACSDRQLVCGALRLFAAYRFHCASRTAAIPALELDIFRALDCAVKDAAARHPATQQVLARLWH